MNAIKNCVAAALEAVVRFVLWLTPLRRAVQRLARARIFARLAALGVDQRADERRLRAALGNLDAALRRATDDSVRVPAHYAARESHAYARGDLGWRAALEAPALTLAAAAVAYPALGVRADAHMRQRFLRDVARVAGRARRVCDLACGTGASTRAAAHALGDASVLGVDLSPYFLAVARVELASELAGARVALRHANAEEPFAAAGSFDAVLLSGATHEMPTAVRRRVFANARRLLRRGGVFALLDVDPARIRRMPRPVYLLFKSTEPDMDDYLAADMPAELRERGFAVLPDDAALAAAASGRTEAELAVPRIAIERRLSIIAIAA